MLWRALCLQVLRRGGSGRWPAWHARPHPAAPHRFKLDAEFGGATLVRRLGATSFHVYGPVVQRAGHAGAKHNALAQRAALVRATVEQGEYLVLVVAEDGDIQALGACNTA